MGEGAEAPRTQSHQILAASVNSQQSSFFPKSKVKVALKTSSVRHLPVGSYVWIVEILHLWSQLLAFL